MYESHCKHRQYLKGITTIEVLQWNWRGQKKKRKFVRKCKKMVNHIKTREIKLKYMKFANFRDSQMLANQVTNMNISSYFMYLLIYENSWKNHSRNSRVPNYLTSYFIKREDILKFLHPRTGTGLLVCQVCGAVLNFPILLWTVPQCRQQLLIPSRLSSCDPSRLSSCDPSKLSSCDPFRLSSCDPPDFLWNRCPLVIHWISRGISILLRSNGFLVASLVSRRPFPENKISVAKLYSPKECWHIL